MRTSALIAGDDMIIGTVTHSHPCALNLLLLTKLHVHYQCYCKLLQIYAHVASKSFVYVYTEHPAKIGEIKLYMYNCTIDLNFKGLTFNMMATNCYSCDCLVTF